MKKILTTIFFTILFTPAVFAYTWTSAIPREIHIVPQGLVLVGDFDNSGVTCANGTTAIFLSGYDPVFKEKLTLALTAKATDKQIRVAVNEPVSRSCVNIPELGSIPVASPYFWQLID